MMKAYFKAIILSLKIYKNIQKLYFLMGGGGGGGAERGGVCIRHIDCLCKYFGAVIYWCKGAVIL